MLHFINHIHQYNYNISQIKKEQYIFLCKKDKNLFAKIIENIYLSDHKLLLNYLEKANNIIKHKKYFEITELYDSANNLILYIENNKTINIITLNNFIEEFEMLYNKFLDSNYRNFIDNIKKMSNSIQLLLINYDECYKNIFLKTIDEIYNINKLLLVQYLANKCKFIFDTDKYFFEYSWNLISKTFEINQHNTIYILLLELRNLLIQSCENTEVKKHLYYNFDIEVIKLELQCTDINKIYLSKSVNLYCDLFKISNCHSNLQSIFNNIKEMYYIFCSNFNNNFFNEFYEIHLKK